jgi:hypothetical protein
MSADTGVEKRLAEIEARARRAGCPSVPGENWAERYREALQIRVGLKQAPPAPGAGDLEAFLDHAREDVPWLAHQLRKALRRMERIERDRDLADQHAGRAIRRQEFQEEEEQQLWDRWFRLEAQVDGLKQQAELDTDAELRECVRRLKVPDGSEGPQDKPPLVRIRDAAIAVIEGAMHDPHGRNLYPALEKALRESGWSPPAYLEEWLAETKRLGARGASETGRKP